MADLEKELVLKETSPATSRIAAAVKVFPEEKGPVVRLQNDLTIVNLQAFPRSTCQYLDELGGLTYCAVYGY